MNGPFFASRRAFEHFRNPVQDASSLFSKTPSERLGLQGERHLVVGLLTLLAGGLAVVVGACAFRAGHTVQTVLLWVQLTLTRVAAGLIRRGRGPGTGGRGRQCF